MNGTINIQKNIITFGVPFLIIGSVALLAKSPLFAIHPDSLSIGITFDLLITAPLVYFLLIRKTTIPKTTIVPFLILGVIIGTSILPPENQFYLNLFKTWILPIVELSILSFVVYKVRAVVKRYKLQRKHSFDFFTTLKHTCQEILPKAAIAPAATEIAVFYYGFIYWRKRELKENEFSYHKESGTIALLIAFIFIVGIETFVCHMLLIKWSTIAAWILTCLSIYSSFQLFGFLKSILKRPILIEDNNLYLRYGIMSESTINIKEIDSIELSSKDLEDTKEIRKFSFLGELESHNVIIRLKAENTLTGLYGMKSNFKALALHVDNKNEFKNRIDNML